MLGHYAMKRRYSQIRKYIPHCIVVGIGLTDGHRRHAYIDNLVKFGRVVFEICCRTSTLCTDVQTRSSQYFASHEGEGDVKIRRLPCRRTGDIGYNTRIMMNSTSSQWYRTVSRIILVTTPLGRVGLQGNAEGAEVQCWMVVMWQFRRFLSFDAQKYGASELEFGRSRQKSKRFLYTKGAMTHII